MKLPNDVIPAVKDMLPYFDSGRTAPALEFLSPIKGPNLPQICVEVGSGLASPEQGAAGIRPGRGEAGKAARLARLVGLRGQSACSFAPWPPCGNHGSRRGGRTGRGCRGPGAILSPPARRSRAGVALRALKDDMVKALNRRHYSYAFLLPALAIYGGLFLLPTLMLSLLQPDPMDSHRLVLHRLGQLRHVLHRALPQHRVHATRSCTRCSPAVLKVVLGLLLGMFLSSGIRTQGYLRSVVFFPNLLSTIAVGITFSSLMHPTRGVINKALSLVGITGPDWLGNVHIALLSVVLVDVWKGVGVATVIYIAGIMSIPRQYYEALSIDGGNGWNRFRSITLPLVRPAMNSVIILAFIGGLRTFDLVWVMTKGGPGFTTDLIASIIYKQYTGGFYGLATAGNVILFVVVSILTLPLYRFLTRHEVDL